MMRQGNITLMGLAIVMQICYFMSFVRVSICYLRVVQSPQRLQLLLIKLRYAQEGPLRFVCISKLIMGFEDFSLSWEILMSTVGDLLDQTR